MYKTTLSLILALLLTVSQAKVYVDDRFNDDKTLTRWIQSKEKDDLGEFTHVVGNVEVDSKEDKGLKTSQDAKFYGISRKFDSFSNKGKDLVIQFTVKHEQGIDCGGGYVKVFDSKVEPEKFHGETPYHVMFGPDICGVGTKKVHVIFGHGGTNHLVKKDIRCKDDQETHMYRLILKPSNEFEVQIDDESVEKGSLEEDFDILPPKEIDDSSVVKPEDWVDEEMMVDPEDKKPEDWDKPKTVVDPEAKKPEDWDEEMDGEWEAPQINNPEYKGEWEPKKIPNPKYKGPWVQPKMKNPDYKEDKELYVYDDIAGIGFDLWQVKSGTIFDNLAICDNVKECTDLTKDIWKKRQDAEKTVAEEKAKKAEEELKKSETKEAEEMQSEGKKGDEDTDEESKSHDEL